MMPIRKECRDLYSPDWPQIAAAIRERAKNRCETCGVANHAVGYRDSEGRFWPTGGNEWHDKAGNGEIPYGEALEGVRRLNACGEGIGPNDERGIVIVLTCAHLNHNPADNRPSNLAALCQRCHNRHDAKNRAAGIRERRRAASGQMAIEVEV